MLTAAALAIAPLAPVAASTSAVPLQSVSTTTDEDVAPTAIPVERLAGRDRYGTAADVAMQWSSGVQRVYVVSGRTYPDAMAAAARAGVFNAPVLLTKPDSLPSETVAALRHLRPDRIVVVGGSSSVSQAVLTELGRHAGSGSAERTRPVARAPIWPAARTSPMPSRPRQSPVRSTLHCC
jgi:putative cell wall-binding protein